MAEVNDIERLGKQVNLKINNYKTQIGTIDSKDGKCVFLTVTGYVAPNDGDLSDLMQSFKFNLKRYVTNGANQIFDLLPTMPVICIVDHSDSLTAATKQRVNQIYTFFSIDITLYFPTYINIKDKDFVDDMSLLTYSIIDYLNENRDLSFLPNKPCKG